MTHADEFGKEMKNFTLVPSLLLEAWDLYKALILICCSKLFKWPGLTYYFLYLDGDYGCEEEHHKSGTLFLLYHFRAHQHDITSHVNQITLPQYYFLDLAAV
jgi:hypothetical protein